MSFCGQIELVTIPTMLRHNRARSFNQVAAIATATSEPILKADHLKEFCKRKMSVVNGNTWETPTGSMAASHLPLPVSL